MSRDFLRVNKQKSQKEQFLSICLCTVDSNCYVTTSGISDTKYHNIMYMKPGRGLGEERPRCLGILGPGDIGSNLNTLFGISRR